ncbi:uncharacterized protein LOC133372678 [Rhineura floridana]|uniref:uncharacterized protein LOC133372678 n=1 Tax=Rhineura floridana TaxID=261503 RepID=UPI002AC829A6|nr:uncharacterized protein LOC133372678 [Rhineura floridana]
MWRILTTAVFCYLGRLVHTKCALSQLSNETEVLEILTFGPQHLDMACLNFSGRGVIRIEGNVSLGVTVVELDLSHNKLQSLPPGFLARAKGMKQLRLEGNPLHSVPTDTFSHCLEKLIVSCGCDVVGTIFPYCQNCTPNIECQCFSSQGPVNASDFYAKQCLVSGALYAAILVPILVLVLTAGLAYLLIRKKRATTICQDKQGSSVSDGAHGQPRYISHVGPQGDAARGPGHHTDYENIPVNQPHMTKTRQGERRASKQSTNRLSPQVPDTNGPHSDQPVYANAQDLYYNYVGSAAPAAVDEDIYIIPDQ